MLTEPANAYARRLNTWDAAMIVIGGVIGAGIFLTPATVARHTSSGIEVLSLWVIGGLLTLAGVLCYAELGSRRPQAGGIYVYLREAFGLLPAFLFGWTMALINYPGSVAAVATMFADYFCAAIGAPLLYVKPVAVAAIVFIVGINLFGIRAGAWMQNIFTVLKLAAIALLVVVGLVLAHGHLGLALLPEADHPASSWAFAGALLPVLFTYGGFHYLNDLAGEVRNPQHTLPRALGMGMLGVVICYVLANYAYLAGLGHAGLAASQAPAADLMRRLFGESGATVMAIGIACSTFGYCSIAIAGGARVLQTMGADGVFFRAAGRVDARTRAPQIALVLLGAWAVVLTLSGSFNQLLNYTTVGEWLGHVFGIGTLFWYRKNFIDDPAPYRVPFYPLLPLIFTITVFGVIVASAIHAPGDAGMSLVIIALGVPVYYGWQWWTRGRSHRFDLTRRCLSMKRRAWIVLCLCGLGACHATAPGVADLANTAAAPHVSLDQVHRVGIVEHASDGVAQQRYAFQPAVHPQIMITPADGAWNWSGKGELHMRVQNVMPWAVTLAVEIDGAAGQRLQATVGVPAGPAQTLVIPLHAESPRSEGMQSGPPMPFDDHGRLILLATTVQGALDLHRVSAIRIGVPAPQAAQTLLFGRVDTVPGEAGLRAAYTGIVDRYGQFTRGRWPEKIATDAALRAAHAREQSVPVKVVGQDEYGGRLDVQNLDKTRWFHTQKANGRWELVTPDGHAFFSLGVNAVAADGGRSYIEGRGFMFTGLPPDSGEWAAFYGSGDSRSKDQAASHGNGYNHGRWFDFYAANLYRVDGKDWPSAWRTRTLDRLQAWGFNTIGNWSDPALGQAHRLPYTRSINIAGNYANVASGFDWWGRMPDPFDPRFVQATEAAVAKASAGVRDDPWLLGYFADNELAWAGTGPQGRWGLALGTLAGDARSPAKQVFIAMLRKQYVAPETLSAAWGIALGSWDALNATGFVAPAPNETHPAIANDYRAWLRLYADTYFRTVAEAIHRHDPHHLFLGGRFAVNTPEAVAACAKYCDVVSFNVYADLPRHGFDIAAMHALDKPVLISEFHFGSDDRGPFGKGVVSAGNESQRGEAYARFVAAAVANPDIVGVHWFQYVDQPVTGRLLDGENSHIGLVGITDIPFGGFVEAVRAENRKAMQSATR